MRNPIDLLFPPKCASCGELLPFAGFFPAEPTKESALCPSCLPLWRQEKEDCCGACNEKVATCSCTTKMMQTAGCKVFRKLVYYSPGDREKVGNRIVYRIKDHVDRATVRFLAAELAPLIRESMSRPEWSGKTFFLSYLPRRYGTVLKGGNDQAKELAAALAKELELPLLPLIGRHLKSRAPQKFLTPAKRLSNATGAFYLRKKRKAEAYGKVAVLVDDIVTSGASMTAGTRLLRQAGAVDFLAVAVASDECNRSKSAILPETKGEFDRPYRR